MHLCIVWSWSIKISYGRELNRDHCGYMVLFAFVLICAWSRTHGLHVFSYKYSDHLIADLWRATSVISLHQWYLDRLWFGIDLTHFYWFHFLTQLRSWQLISLSNLSNLICDLFFTCNYLHGGHVGRIRTKESHYIIFHWNWHQHGWHCIVYKGLVASQELNG